MNRAEYYIINYLVTEGYADSCDSAAYILDAMSDEWLDEILEAFKPSDYKEYYRTDHLDPRDDRRQAEEDDYLYYLKNREDPRQKHEDARGIRKKRGFKLQENNFLKKFKFRRLMNQNFNQFDQSQKGWRSLPSEKDQEAAIRLYNTKNTNANTTTKWHLGQVQALRGKLEPAQTNMNASKDPRDPQWNRYVDATTSFLKKDKDFFERAANPKFPNYNKPTIDRLRKNFDKSYKEAY